jgi:hypothetical protein
MKRAWYWSVAALLLGGFLLAGLDLAWRKSATWDETGHLAAGYSYWANGDMRIVTNNGILTQRWAALPLWFSPDRPRFPDAAAQAEQDLNPIDLGRTFLFSSGHDARTLLFRARVMILLLAVGLGLLVLAWARSLFGPAGALGALALYVCCPPVLAHGALVTTDLAASLALLFATAAWWRVLACASLPRVLWFGVAGAVLVLTKFSFLVFLAVAGVLGLARVLRPEPLPCGGRSLATPAARLGGIAAAAILAGLVAWIGLWAAYGFRFSIPGFTFNWESLAPGTLTYRVTAALRRLHLFPEPFIFDLGGLRSLAIPRGTFLHGAYSVEGFRTFFPVAFLIKSTPGFLALAALGTALVSLPRSPEARALAWRALPLLALAVIYFASAVASPLNLGIRHLLPVYAPLCILAGAAVTARLRSLRLLARWVVLPAALVSAVRAHPDELAYTNLLGGGTANGWRWLVGSSYDWGGELIDVARATAPRPGETAGTQYLLYCATAVPAAYGVNAIQLDGYFRPTEDFTRTLRGGTFYTSTTNLQMGTPEAFGPWTAAFEQRYQELRARPSGSPADLAFRERNGLLIARLYSFLRQRTPDGQVAQAVLVFRLTDADVQRVISGPPAELFPVSPVRGWRPPGP